MRNQIKHLQVINIKFYINMRLLNLTKKIFIKKIQKPQNLLQVMFIYQLKELQIRITMSDFENL
ncbi:hypothetical protein pb186bvf_008678 [Paramecium bursaria]